MIQNDAVVFGILAICVAVVTGLSHSKNHFWQKFFSIVPSVLMVYLLPAFLNSVGIIDSRESKVYSFNTDYLLPACLILMTLSLDLKKLVKLGPKCLMIFFAGTIGVILGGPIALGLAKLFFSASVPDDSWKVLTTLAGSWIGGGVNQAAMKQVLQVDDTVFAMVVAVDILVGNAWMAFLLFLANKNKVINKWLKADHNLVNQLDISGTHHHAEAASFKDMTWMLALGFGGMGLCYLLAVPIVDFIKVYLPFLEKYNLTSVFFWVVILATVVGIISSMTKLRELEYKGASKLGTALLYLLVASIGMKIHLTEMFQNPIFIFIGFVWIIIHGIIIMSVTKLLKAPLFFMAVGSQANIGAAASAPIVASAFAPHLAPVGVLLAVLGYVVGNYGAYICGLLMQMVN
ncbi:MAG: DUF819 domain-containing protein [Bacteriovoracaceae bacterium]